MPETDEDELDLLSALNVETTTSENRIVDFINGIDHRVIFCTYRSAPLLVAAVKVYETYLLFVHPHRPMDKFKKFALELKDKYASERAKAANEQKQQLAVTRNVAGLIIR
jgi:hypothetical protein